MLSFFSRGVLDEILDLIESVSEDFPSYSTQLLLYFSMFDHLSNKGHGNIYTAVFIRYAPYASMGQL